MKWASEYPVYFGANSRRDRRFLNPGRRRVFGRVNSEPLWGSDGVWLRLPVEFLVYRNRLVSVEHFATGTLYGTGTSDQLVTYVYDAFNRLIGRTLDPDGTSGATSVEQTVFIHDGDQITHQFDKTGTGDLAASDLSHRYLWNPQAVDQLLADETADDGGEEDVLWALTDHINSVRDLAAYNAGTDTTNIVNHRVYDAFGNLTSETAPAVDCIFGYTGRLWDEDTALQNNLHRWYDPAVGRWLSEDPIGFEGNDLNLYRYVDNQPMLLADPLGLKKKECGGFLEWLWSFFSSSCAPAPVGALEGAPDMANAMMQRKMMDRAMRIEQEFGANSKEAKYAWKEYEAVKACRLKEFSLANPPPPPPFKPAYQGPRPKPQPKPKPRPRRYSY